MPRNKTIRTDLAPCHVVARSHNKKWFPLPGDEMWQIYLEGPNHAWQSEGIKIVAFVLMSNHFHLMLWTSRSNIDRVMYGLMKNSTLDVQKKANVVNSIYGGRYKASLLTDFHYQLAAFKYILRNPVVAGICSRAEDYPHSTYHCQFFNKQLPFEITPLASLQIPESTHFTNDNMELNQWLNLQYQSQEASSIRTGLARPRFQYAKCRSSKKIIRPEILLAETVRE